MQSVSNGLGRTLVVVASTFVCGSALMLAAVGPGLAQANPAPQVPVALKAGRPTAGAGFPLASRPGGPTNPSKA